MVEYYELTKVTISDLLPGEFRIATAALIVCSLCGCCIDGMGGPGTGPICIRCGDVIICGGARGAIKWEEEADDNRE